MTWDLFVLMTNKVSALNNFLHKQFAVCVVEKVRYQAIYQGLS